MEEDKALEKLAEAWNEFLKLDEYQPDHIPDFRYAIHLAQGILMARIAIREYPDKFTRA